MKLRKKRFLRMFLLMVLFLSFLILELDFAQQVSQGVQEEKIQDKGGEQKIIPSPQNIKESTGIYVFVAWMWLAIFVLVYILRLKIREVDRLFKIRFLSSKKK